MPINLPSLGHTAGYPSQWTDTINPVLEGLIVGETPALVTQDMTLAASQTLAEFTPVGFDASNRLVAAAPAAAVLNFTGTGTAADTVTIGGVVYELVASPTDPYDVDIGGTAAQTAANIAAAINGGAGEGTAYGTGTVANPFVTAAVVGTAVTLTAKRPGAVAVAESGTGTNFTGGVTALAGAIQPIGITLYPIEVGAGEYPGVPILRAGCLAKHMIAWPASFITDAQKLNAFAGAPTPTNIVVREVYFGSTVSAP